MGSIRFDFDLDDPRMWIKENFKPGENFLVFYTCDDKIKLFYSGGDGSTDTVSDLIKANCKKRFIKTLKMTIKS